MMWVWIWLGVVAVTLLFEFITMELASVWFSLGGFVALILAVCDVSVEVQWIVFGLVSILSILLLRKVSLKYLLKNSNERISNTDMTIGKNFELLTDINPNQRGTIKVNDVVWMVVAVDSSSEIKAGTRVEVVELKGNKYVVKPFVLDNDKKEEKN
ncbi:MAG: NfeD family protein [Clostridia bacterium]|nr:NfeD family protein [Clostridia bacterium]